VEVEPVEQAVLVGPGLTPPYHDEEWGGRSSRRRLFERLCLEGSSPGSADHPAQGRRSGGVRGFRRRRRRPARATWAAAVDAHRSNRQVDATIANARAAAALCDGGLAAVVGRRPRAAAGAPGADVSCHDAGVDRLSRELAPGFRFVGPTTVYAAMQACGVVNDHVLAAWCGRGRASAARGVTPKPRA
jgi:DNA-3-methyladenine glycosylase I